MNLRVKRIRPALVLALCLSSAQAPQVAPGTSGTPLAAAARFEGSPAEAMEAIRRLSADEPERALLIARQLGDDESFAEPLRAEFRFAQGVVQAGMGAPVGAIDPFLSARALAGPGELRDAATYDQGTVQLLIAEALREEAFRAMMDPAAAGDPTMQGATADAKDPLSKPRRAYLAAKETLLERLRASGGADTADTRANLELIQRRLRELDELQQDQQEQQQQQQGDEQSEPQDGDQQQSEDDQQGQEGDQQSKDDQQQQQGEEGEEGQDQEDQVNEPDPNAEQQEQGPTDSGQLPDVTETPGSADGRPAERLLSREEVLRLLDTLEALEGEREAIEAQLRAVRRVPVDEDW